MGRRAVVASVLIAGMALVSGSVQGQDDTENSVFGLSLDELLNLKVSVASRRDEIVRDAPAVMTIVTREEIEAFGARNLVDVIDRLPGMHVVGHAGFYANKIQLRAQPNSSQDRHTLIMINGRPVRENINGGNNAYFYLGFPVAAIESIEIIRGPGSVLYGSNAFAATINIRTRRAISGDNAAGQLSATYGSRDTGDLHVLSLGCTADDFRYLAAARLSRSEGPTLGWTSWTDPNNPATHTYGSTEYTDDSDAFYLNLGNDTVQLQTAYHRYSPGDFGTLGRHNDAIYIDRQDVLFADLGLTHHLNEATTASLNLTLNMFRWRGSNDGNDFFDRRRSKNLIFEPMLRVEPLPDLNLVLGGTLEYDSFGGHELFDHDRFIHSFYGQADWQITSWLKPLVGLQYNKSEGASGNLSPRFGLVLTPTEHWGAKLLYSEAFRRAFAAEGYLDSPFLLGNTTLEPEVIETYEAQINYQNHQVSMDLTYFHSRQSIIEVDFNANPLRFINHSGYSTTEGVEFSSRFVVGDHWQALGSATCQSTRNTTGEPFMDPNYPDYMVKCGLIGTYDRVRLGLFNSYLSSGSWRHEQSNNLQANVSLDLSPLLGLPRDRMRFSVFGDNLLDEKLFQLPSDIGLDEPMPQSYGRRLYATLTLTW